jgi:hypothetical protein
MIGGAAWNRQTLHFINSVAPDAAQHTTLESFQLSNLPCHRNFEYAKALRRHYNSAIIIHSLVYAFYVDFVK